MAKSTVILATTFTKLYGPSEITVKLDGVAADFRKQQDGWHIRSRSDDKPIVSAPHIVKLLNDCLPNSEIGTHIVGELTVAGEPVFQIACGIIRRNTPDKRITLNVYDVWRESDPDAPYSRRMKWRSSIVDVLSNLSVESQDNLIWRYFVAVPSRGIVTNTREFEEAVADLDQLLEQSPTFEGYMVRVLDGPHSVYRPNWRSKGFARYKPQPTLDLEVVDFEEAVANRDPDSDGNPQPTVFLGEEFNPGQGLNAVGRIVCKYKGEEIGVGPGTLTHVERRTLWLRYLNMKANGLDLRGRGLIAEVKYMLDPNYTALRQPTFLRWRTDKTESSEVA